MNANNPLLVFQGYEISKKTEGKRKNIKPNLNTPSFEKQNNRLSPKFETLENVLKNKNLSAHFTSLGLEPECTVVMEIVGNLENFLGIAKKTEGLEWLAEFNNEDLEPDEDFYSKDKDDNRTDKKLGSKLFISMANQKAIDEIISLWQKYKKNPDIKFERGKNKLKEVFKYLYDLRRWSISDRFEDSHLLEDWDFRRSLGETTLPVEIELWYRINKEQRIKYQELIEALVKDIGGKIITSSIIEEIRYHAILAHIPSSKFANIQDFTSVELVKCDGIMFLKPVSQALVKNPVDDPIVTYKQKNEQHQPSKHCVVCILDGLPAVNHPALKDFIILDDPDDFTSKYNVNEMKHGTAICSIILKGDLNKEEKPLNQSVYVRPILKPDQGYEKVPEDYLPVDLTYRAIKDLFENNFGIFDSIKIVNLSIGDSDRHFAKVISPWARLIDYLSWKYNLLFCISAGNYGENLHLGKSWREWLSLEEDKKNENTLSGMLLEDRHRKIISPAESINSITVGAVHDDFNNDLVNLLNRVEVINNNALPSTITRFGLGIRNSVKPDISVPGGRQLYTKPALDKDVSLKINEISSRPPGICVATPNNKIMYTKGTSFSCAFTTRAAAQLYQELENIGFGGDSNIAVLLKTLLVHSAHWNGIDNIVKNICKKDCHWSEIKRITTKILGYGKPDFSKVLSCSNQQATIIYRASIDENEGHTYKFPLPPSLSGKKEWFRVIITLGWFSPINYEHSKYRRAKLWFDPSNDSNFCDVLGGKLIGVEKDRAQRGTVQHQIFENEQAQAFVDGDDLQIKINCKSEDNRKLQESIPYGLAITLEVKEGINIPVYQEVKSRIRVQEQIKPLLKY